MLHGLYLYMLARNVCFILVFRHYFQLPITLLLIIYNVKVLKIKKKPVTVVISGVCNLNSIHDVWIICTNFTLNFAHFVSNSKKRYFPESTHSASRLWLVVNIFGMLISTYHHQLYLKNTFESCFALGSYNIVWCR